MKRPGIIAVVLLLALPMAGADGDPSFRTAVLPVLTKAGCNAGACHGAATGQGGFRLSLLGYDPDEDYDRITREFGGRRMDRDDPTGSLLLRKASGGLGHEGGRRLPRDSSGHELLRRWIAAGAPPGPRDLRVTRIDVEPASALLPAPGSVVNLRVTAAHSDGSSADVTSLALYSSGDDAIATVGIAGEVRGVGRGLTSIMVRHGGQVAAVRIASPLRDAPVSAGLFDPVNDIDEQVLAGLRELRVPASPPCDDATFLRRLHLDLTGRLPSPDRARAFLGAPASEAKRRREIDAVLESDAFVDFWTWQLGDLLLFNDRGEPGRAFHVWLRSQVAGRVPFDVMVRSVLTATGRLDRVGPAGFYQLANDPRDLAEQVGRMFLGQQVACARCHAHPSDRWTQEDYHRFAACFARVAHDGGLLRVTARGDVEHPRTGMAMPPAPLGGDAFRHAGTGDRRLALADWLTAPENPWFARTLANRVWRQLMGRGLVEPVDDLRPTNPATHPALLDALAAELVAHRFEVRHLMRTIVTSRTWQLSSHSVAGNQADTRLRSHASLKPLPAAVFADAVADVTGVPDEFAGWPRGTRAVQLAGPATPSPALDVLGRCQRRRACDENSAAGGGMARALHLINGGTINDKLQPQFIAPWAARSNRDVVTELYLRALVREPSADERAGWESALAAAPDRVAAIQDFLWTVLNSREFAVNH